MGNDYGLGLKQTPASQFYKPRNMAVETNGFNPAQTAKSGIGSFLMAGLTGTNPVAGMMMVLGTQLLGSWLSPEPKQVLTPEERMYKKRMAYFSDLGKSRTAMKHLASGMTGKPVSYFDKSIGSSDMSDVFHDDTKFAKHIALADGNEVG